MRKWMRMWKQQMRTTSAILGLAALAGAPALADDVEAPVVPVPEKTSCVGSECPEVKAEKQGSDRVAPNSWNAQRRIPGVSAFVNGTGYWGPSKKPGYDD